MRYKYFFYSLLPVLIVCLLISCVPKDGPRNNSNPAKESTGLEQNFTAVHEDAVDKMLGNCIVNIDKSKPVIVTSLVDIDNMHKSSTLGRMSSEMIAARLAQHGFRVQEVKMGQTDIFVSEEEGEMILSRSLHQIGRKHDVQGFVVGTYAIGTFHRYDVDVFVSLRFVDVNNIIGCSVNYIIKNSEPELWK